MKLTSIVFVAGLALFLGEMGARAQDAGDLAGAIAVAGEGVGQSLGQSMGDARTVFVTATGRAPLPAPLPDAYQVELSDSAPTAVQAAAERDATVAKLMAVARAHGASASQRQQTISLGGAQSAGMAFPIPIPAAPRSTPSEGDAASKPQFVAKAIIRFGEPRSGSAAAFVDALHEAGAGSITSGENQGSFFTRVVSGSQTGSPPEPDSKVWDEAMVRAMRTAREAAVTLAAAAGEGLGEARQILLVWRSFNDKEAIVTIAARFGLTKEK